jgi:hypothetical protein
MDDDVRIRCVFDEPLDRRRVTAMNDFQAGAIPGEAGGAATGLSGPVESGPSADKYRGQPRLRQRFFIQPCPETRKARSRHPRL